MGTRCCNNCSEQLGEQLVCPACGKEHEPVDLSAIDHPVPVTPPTLSEDECKALRSHASTNGSKFTRNLLLTIADRFDPPKKLTPGQVLWAALPEGTRPVQSNCNVAAAAVLVVWEAYDRGWF